MKATDIVFSIVKPIAEEYGLNIWDVIFEKEGINWFLRIYLDKNNGAVTIDDCEKISNRVSDKLDELDPIEQSYYLEVSSAGLGRKLRKEEHFLKLIGEQISLKLYKSFEGKKHFTGILRGFKDDYIKLETEDEMFNISFSDCSYVKLDDDLDLF